MRTMSFLHLAITALLLSAFGADGARGSRTLLQQRRTVAPRSTPRPTAPRPTRPRPTARRPTAPRPTAPRPTAAPIPAATGAPIPAATAAPIPAATAAPIPAATAAPIPAATAAPIPADSGNSGSGSSGGGGGGGNSGSGNSGSGGGGGGGGARTFVSPFPSPFDETECDIEDIADKGVYEARGYPSSPFPTTPFVFVQKFKPLTTITPNVSRICNADNYCIEGYEFSIMEFMKDFGLTGTACAGPSVPSLGYNGIVPGALVDRTQGVPHVSRYTNNVSPNSRFFPPAGPGNAGSEETKDLCRDRAERFEHYPGIAPGTGRGFSVHHHGEASTSDMDGWAEQFICAGESKDYVIPNNRPATLWYHDHAVGITSENVYAGLVSMLIVRPCSAAGDPFQVEALAGRRAVTEHQLILSDYVLSAPRRDEPGVCRLRYDRQGDHEDNLWGDINAVNGVPWPVLDVRATWNRFRILGASESRPWILQIWDATGAEVSSKICKIIGADGGFADTSKNWPGSGLLTDVAYRWDAVCDFTAYSSQSLYLINRPNQDLTTSETPYFCHSHLVMKINVGAPDAAAAVPNLAAFNTELRGGPLPLDLIETLQQRALKGEYDRQLDFGRGGGIWVVNGRGWDYKDPKIPGKPHIEYDDIGQNNIELWNFKSGGGWIHPIHVHLVDFFCLAIKESGWQPCPQELNNMPKDALHIGANLGEVIVGARFGPHLGEYMMHCHNGVHEDHEMMRAFMVSDAIGGKTFEQTPQFNVTLLRDTPPEAEMQWGDWRDTTYGGNAAPPAPAFNQQHILRLLNRGYYDIFYPPAGSPLNDPEANFWLPICRAAPPAGVVG